MSSLTIRLDKDTDAMLSQLAERLQQSKSTLAREGINRYLEEQLKKEQLAANISCNSMETVRQRIAESEAGQYLTDEEYERSMDEFFAKELGLVR